MDRKQKYFDFIIKDLISNTELVGNIKRGVEVFLPFDTLSDMYPPIITLGGYSKSWKDWSTEFGLGMMASKYLEDKYGFNRRDYYQLLDAYWSVLKEKAKNN